MSDANVVVTWSNNWMSAIDDAAPICEVSIPGSHESCARYGGSSAHCQWRSVIDQLSRGIRFLDVRCDVVAPKGEAGSPVDEAGDPEIYLFVRHGTMNQAITFQEIQAQCVAFLATNPSEFILMNLQMEDTTDGDTFARKFTEMTQPYLNYWHFDDALKKDAAGNPVSDFPKVGDVRGRIILIRATAGGGWPTNMKPGSLPGQGGMVWNGCEIDDVSSSTLFQTQNGWSKWNGTEKGDEVEKYLKHADAWAKQGQMTLNFASYSWGAQSPGRNAAGMNVRLQKFLKNYDFGSVLGVVPIDFVSNTGDSGESLENLIIQHQRHQKAGFSYGGLASWVQP